MKKVLILGMALALSGCAGTVPTSVTPTKISETAKQIQTYTKLGCSFIPTVATIAAILSSGASAPIAAIASDICAAVTTAPLADGGPRQAKVNGVVIRGKFVR